MSSKLSSYLPFDYIFRNRVSIWGTTKDVLSKMEATTNCEHRIPCTGMCNRHWTYACRHVGKKVPSLHLIGSSVDRYDVPDDVEIDFIPTMQVRSIIGNAEVTRKKVKGGEMVTINNLHSPYYSVLVYVENKKIQHKTYSDDLRPGEIERFYGAPYDPNKPPENKVQFFKPKKYLDNDSDDEEETNNSGNHGNQTDQFEEEEESDEEEEEDRTPENYGFRLLTRRTWIRDEELGIDHLYSAPPHPYIETGNGVAQSQQTHLAPGTNVTSPQQVGTQNHQAETDHGTDGTQLQQIKMEPDTTVQTFKIEPNIDDIQFQPIKIERDTQVHPIKSEPGIDGILLQSIKTEPGTNGNQPQRAQVTTPTLKRKRCTEHDDIDDILNNMSIIQKWALFNPWVRGVPQD